jgi:hypothetical protein
VLIDGEEAYEVEAIIGERLHASWEPERQLREDMDAETLDAMVKEYREANAATTGRARTTLLKAKTTAMAMQLVEDDARERAPCKSEQKARERPILYLSQTLRTYERNYTMLELDKTHLNVDALSRLERQSEKDREEESRVARERTEGLRNRKVERKGEQGHGGIVWKKGDG